MQTVPHTGGLPVTQSSPAGHATAKAQFLGQVLPRRARAQHEQDAIQGQLITQSWLPPLGEGFMAGSNDSSLLYSAVPIFLFLFFPMPYQTHIRHWAMTGFC